MKNVKIKGAEQLQKIRKQGNSEEYWYFNDKCILVTNYYDQEVLQIGDWYHG